MDLTGENSDVRRRHVGDESDAPTNDRNSDIDGQSDVLLQEQRNDENRPHEQSASLPKASFAFLAIGFFHVLMVSFIHYRLNTYPVPKSIALSKLTDFIEENAREHLDVITGFGPRVSGSASNRKAEEYIIEQVKHIKRESRTSNTIEYDVQITSGGFTLDFINVGLGEFTSVYQDLRNIVVKVSPPKNVSSSILVNCHYDTVVDSPGAGDDAVSCCVMLEILRSLSQSQFSLKHNFVFLFNSAEENILQTSHGFITQHPWASDIKAFINLDSAGAGGWEMVFQTGPDHPWLIKAYIESAPHPHASVIGQEIFQTGLIPSDTDFRIFRDYGKIPGIDIAHIKNGYVYHTKNDKPKFIQPGCMQRGGENIKALLLTLGQSSKVANPGEDKHGTMVFYDFVGFFMVAYPSRIAAILNWTTFIYVYVAFLKRLLRESSSSNSNVLGQMGLVIFCVFITWVICLVGPLGMALMMTLAGRSLTYFTHNLNVVWLFILPAVLMNIVFHHFLKKTAFKNIPPIKIVSMIQDANMFLWSLVLAVMTSFGIMSAFMPLLCILCPALLYTFLGIFGLKPSSVVFNMVAAFVPSFYMLSLSYALQIFLVPIMGRSGMETQPDLLIAAISALPVIVCLPYHIGFVYTHSQVDRVIYTTFAVIVLGILAVLFTPAGFPYSSKSTDASPQRAILVHFDRRFHSSTTEVIRKDSSVWYKPIDKNGAKFFEQSSPEVFAQAQKASCDGVYCGRPYLYPFLRLVDARKTFDFPASPLPMPHVDVKLVKHEVMSENMRRLSFNMSGPSHVTIFITELPGVSVKKWSFGHNVPIQILTVPPIHMPTFFIYYSHAGPPSTTWEFDLELQNTASHGEITYETYLEPRVVQLEEISYRDLLGFFLLDVQLTETFCLIHIYKVSSQMNDNSSLIKMGFAGHFLHGPNQVSKDLQKLEHQLPRWMSAVMWSATYDEYFF